MNESSKLSYELTKEVAKLSPGLLVIIVRACGRGEKFVNDFTYSLGQIHAALKRFYQNSFDLLVFKNAIESRLQVIDYTIDHAGALPPNSKACDEDTKRALVELDLASKGCVDRKIDMMAFCYAMEYCSRAIYWKIVEGERNQKER